MEIPANTRHCHVSLPAGSADPKAFRSKQRKKKTQRFRSKGAPWGSGSHSQTTNNRLQKQLLCRSLAELPGKKLAESVLASPRLSHCCEPPSASQTQRSPQQHFVKKEQSAKSKAETFHFSRWTVFTLGVWGVLV